MRKLLLAVTLACVGGGATRGADHVIPAGKFADLKYAIGKGDKSTVRVRPDPPQKAEGLEPGRFIFTGEPGKTYVVRGYIVNLKADKFEEVDDTVTFGGKVPPGPEPTPPTPTPVPDGESPFKEPGFRTLYLYESAELAKLPPARFNALYDSAALTILNQKAVTGADGETREWRKWDKDIKTTNETKVWQDAVARANTKYREWEAKNPGKCGLPWVMVGDGKTGWEGPVESDSQVLDVIRRYAPK